VRCDLGVRYPTVEHAYQAMKTLDRRARERLAELSKPGLVCDTRSRHGPRSDVTRRVGFDH
jgi:predicted NAD-dependent protein-ADP-ribosyltransferase YbiA (DUF1768 family)